ncbi:MFS transporter [Ferviditalea candida]|uniref:MFS transporter n=1 Tax=Ferviditalea candida TaxID=3108399 RepID=A0ABU5ZGT0_9BACL|nr:MFS transporter [Paenibacillaceae bacterium T2]
MNKGLFKQEHAEGSKFYYGYVIVFLSFLVLFASMGIRGTFGTFVTPWETTFGASRLTVSFVSFTSLVIFGISIVAAGRLSDRWGPRKVLSLGLFILGICMAASFFAKTIWHLAILYGVLASVGFGFTSNVTVSVAIVRWFKQKQGLMISIIVLGMAGGPTLFAPMNIYLIDWIGWRWMFVIYGAIYALILTPLYFFLYKDRPAAAPAAEPPVQERAKKSAKTTGVRPASILRQPVTWMLVIPYVICGFTDIGLIQTHLVPLGEDRHFSNTTMADVMLVYGVLNIIGTVGVGYLTDLMSSKKILFMLYSLRVVGLLILSFTNDSVWLFIFAAMYGLTDIATIAPFTMLCSKIYGVERMGSAFGFISFFHQFGAAAGSLVPGILFGISHNYASTLWLSTGLLVFNSIMILSVNESRTTKAAVSVNSA